MTTKVSVDPDDIARQVRIAHDVADGLRTAAQAGDSIRLNPASFGLMCQFLVPPTATLTSMATLGIRALEGIERRTADELKGVVEDFERFEQQVEDVCRRIDQAVSEVSW